MQHIIIYMLIMIECYCTSRAFDFRNALSLLRLLVIFDTLKTHPVVAREQELRLLQDLEADGTVVVLDLFKLL